MSSTPPLSPTSSRDVARRLERSNRIIGSPESRRLPTGPSVPLTSNPSINQHSFGAIPTDLTTHLSSIPLIDEQIGLHPSTSAIALAPPPVFTPMALPAPPSDRQTLSSAQLTAALAALPPLPPQPRRRARARQNPVCISCFIFYLTFSNLYII